MKLFEGLNFKKTKATRFHKFFIFSTPQFGPFSVALSLYLFVLTILAVLHGGIFDATMSLVFPGLAFYSLLSVMAAWFSSLVNESRGFTEPIRRGLRIGMILFIASEVMFFFAFFWAFFHVSLSPPVEFGCVWPPKALQPLIGSPYSIPLLNTMLLLVSGMYITYAHVFIERGLVEAEFHHLRTRTIFRLLFAQRQLSARFMREELAVLTNHFAALYNLSADRVSQTMKHYVATISAAQPFEALDLSNGVVKQQVAESTFWLFAEFKNVLSFLKRKLNVLFVLYLFPAVRPFNIPFVRARATSLFSQATQALDFSKQGVASHGDALLLQNNLPNGSQRVLFFGALGVYLRYLLEWSSAFNSFGARCVWFFVKGWTWVRLPIVLTLVCSAAFTFCQGFEYLYSDIYISDGVYGSVFYLLTGFHGLHVLIGTIFIAVCLSLFLSKQRLYFYSDGHLVSFECAIWYWHFVDVVWLFLYIFLYIWGSEERAFYIPAFNFTEATTPEVAALRSLLGVSDFAFDKQLFFQDSASEAMDIIVNLHNYIMFYIILIFIFVLWLFVNLIYTNGQVGRTASNFFLPGAGVSVNAAQLRLLILASVSSEKSVGASKLDINNDNTRSSRAINF